MNARIEDGTGSEAALDGAALDRLRRLGGDTLIGRMIDLFLKNAVQRMESARAGLAAGDLDAVARGVHSLKSSAANLGASRLHRVAEDVEILADAGDAPGVADRFPELERDFAAALGSLTQLRNALRTS